MAAMNMRNETMGFKQVGLLFGCVMLVAGCAGTGGYAPVVDSGRPVSNEDMQTGAGVRGLLGGVVLVAGWAGPGGWAPVVDAGGPVANEARQTGAGVRGQGEPAIVQPSPQQDDGGVIVMVPDGMGGSSAVQSYALD